MGELDGPSSQFGSLFRILILSGRISGLHARSRKIHGQCQQHAAYQGNRYQLNPAISHQYRAANDHANTQTDRNAPAEPDARTTPAGSGQ